MSEAISGRDAHMILVPETGLVTALKTLAPVIRGQELARLAYKEAPGSGGGRFTPARTEEQRRLMSWWKMTCRITGLDDGLSNW